MSCVRPCVVPCLARGPKNRRLRSKPGLFSEQPRRSPAWQRRRAVSPPNGTSGSRRVSASHCHCGQRPWPAGGRPASVRAPALGWPGLPPACRPSPQRPQPLSRGLALRVSGSAVAALWSAGPLIGSMRGDSEPAPTVTRRPLPPARAQGTSTSTLGCASRVCRALLASRLAKRQF